MKLVHNTQIWEGIFTYNDGYDEADQYIDVDFKLELTFTGNSFNGIATDSESKDLFGKPATINGFVDDEKISFIKDYPCYYYRDENGQLRLDTESKHPEIHYLGYWDGDRNSVYGTWEMIIDEVKYGDGYLEELATGTFEIRRVK